VASRSMELCGVDAVMRGSIAGHLGVMPTRCQRQALARRSPLSRRRFQLIGRWSLPRLCPICCVPSFLWCDSATSVPSRTMRWLATLPRW
jgi:hypothetical protein